VQSAPKATSTPQEKVEVKTTSSAKPAETPKTNNANSNNSNGGNTNSNVGQSSSLIAVKDTCNGQGSGAIAYTTVDNGPNGHQDWLMCGIEGPGWQPPHVTLEDLKIVDLADALKDPNSPFHACTGAIIDKFYEKGNKYGISPTVLASIAMQESSCNPGTIGGAGEQGLMQITQDKCGRAPGGNCRDIDYNIDTGAAFFAQTLKDCGYNILEAAGKYNGYRIGLTKAQATAAAYTTCCRCQNNLDYVSR
jgi:hypothetical protein